MGYSWFTSRTWVEKELEISKEDIGSKISIKEYNDACKNVIYTNVGMN